MFYQNTSVYLQVTERDLYDLNLRLLFNRYTYNLLQFSEWYKRTVNGSTLFPHGYPVFNTSVSELDMSPDMEQ